MLGRLLGGMRRRMVLLGLNAVGARLLMTGVLVMIRAARDRGRAGAEARREEQRQKRDDDENPRHWRDRDAQELT
jgi:hypothetical protein